jgi:uncharacterized protein YggT (Ycf19 family)
LTIKILLTVFGTIFFLLVIIRILRKFIHTPAPSIIGRFLDSNHRRRLQPPDKVIQRSGIKEGMVGDSSLMGFWKLLELFCKIYKTISVITQKN